MSLLKRLSVGFALAATLGLGVAVAQQVAPSATKQPGPTTQTWNSVASAKPVTLNLIAGKSRLFRFKEPATRLSVGDPAIADVMLVNNQEVYLLGKKTGSTNVLVWHAENRMTALELVVGVDTATLQSILSQLMPREKNLKVIATGETLTLTGQVSDAVKVQQAVQVAEEFSGKKVLNMLTTDHLPQVLIEVKVAEVNKNLAEQLGVNLSGSDFAFSPIGGAVIAGATSTMTSNLAGQFGSTNAWLQAQVTNGAATILAEPNIMAISGQEGQFLVGGKVYLPVPQSNAVGGSSVITLQEEPYGIGIRFTPTVLEGGRINLKVRPEVSEISQTGIPVTAGGSTSVLPTIVTRQASTTVQLYDGQSLAIGGLIKNNMVENISAFPGLANLPIIGALFRSTSYSTGRTELLIIVTTRIVEPSNHKLEMPTDKFKRPSEGELFLQGKMEGAKPLAPATGGVQ